MIKAMLTQHNRNVSNAFFIIGCVCVMAAIMIGIDDNVTGILCAYGASAAFLLACVHPWRAASKYGLLLLASVIVFVVAGVLHNILHGVAGNIEGAGTVQVLLESLSAAAFLLAVLVCPPAFLVGLLGSFAMLLRNRHVRSHA